MSRVNGRSELARSRNSFRSITSLSNSTLSRLAKKGMNTVEACEGIIAGKVSAFLMLGGNFVRAIPERAIMEAAWQRLDLTVSISTKLNRSHLVHGKASYILPCLGRTEIDLQATGRQAVSVEDSTGFFHASRGFQKPASEHLRSEPTIVAEIAKATLPGNPKVDWDRWLSNYDHIRESIEDTYPGPFYRFQSKDVAAGRLPAKDPRS